jgi:predicted metalloprotease with PDZ domain
MKHVRLWMLSCVVLMNSLATSQTKAPTIQISLDATHAPRKIFHATLSIPSAPGKLTLYYPKWIPGEHGPTGPVQELVGLKFKASGKELAWRRDLLDGWTFHVEVPQGATAVEAELDYLAPAAQGIYTAGASATEKMAVLSWNTMLLYPAGFPGDAITFEASVRLPAGWKFGTPLPIASQSGEQIKFKPASLTTLVDSPIITGQFLKVVPLAKNPTQELDIAADSAAALDVPDSLFESYRKLTDQAQKLFGAQHFREYHFLYSLSDYVAHFGLEHHESNDSRLGERALVDEDKRKLGAGLLTHEYVHSWNGKYRRPADLATPDYQKPMQTDLLWVYEGLTSYLGDLLAARSGVRTPEQARDSLALIAADLDHRSGRAWRNLQDTADGVPAMQGAPEQWTSWRRPLDYYEEDVLNWLWADVIIRQQTKGAKSLDDFCKLFHGGQGGAPALKTYTFDDLVATLNQVAPYDWRAFWTERLTNHRPNAPLSGIEGSGWRLTYNDTPSELAKAGEDDDKTIDSSYSIGLMMKEDGSISDTIENMPAAKAGIGPGMKVMAVNGRKFSRDVLRDALKAGQNGSEPLDLLVENTEYYRTFKLDYHGGEKFPHLERDESKPDLLSEIHKAR